MKIFVALWFLNGYVILFQSYNLQNAQLLFHSQGHLGVDRK